jgi:hypothetical protein
VGVLKSPSIAELTHGLRVQPMLRRIRCALAILMHASSPQRPPRAEFTLQPTRSKSGKGNNALIFAEQLSATSRLPELCGTSRSHDGSGRARPSRRS